MGKKMNKETHPQQFVLVVNRTNKSETLLQALISQLLASPSTCQRPTSRFRRTRTHLYALLDASTRIYV
jgi:hypothetical protein